MSKKVKNEAPVKLNVGCFNKKFYGFINVDCREETNADVIDDIKTLSKFEKNSVDLIVAIHVLEHLDRKSVVEALKRWFEVLKPNNQSKVFISVPDMEAVFAHYFYWKDLKILYSCLGGSQRHVADYHLSHFVESTLKELMEDAGFKDVKLYDRWKTEWSYNDTYEAAYYPHANYPAMHNGSPYNKLMSLNMEGTKP